MKQSIKLAFTFVIATLLMVSCAKKDARELKSTVSSFLNGNEQIVAFGSVRLDQILQKTDYKNQPKAKAIIDDEFGFLYSSIKMDLPIYYAVEADQEDYKKQTVYLFMAVKNRDSLASNITKKGFEVEKNKSFHYFSDGDMSCAFNDNIAWAVIKPGVEDPVKLLTETWESTTGNEDEGMIASILDKKDDFVSGTNLLYVFNAMNTAILSTEKQKELTRIIGNSYMESALNFNKGEIVWETKNHFTKELKNKLFFNTDKNAAMLKDLGAGVPKAGLSMNIDTRKMQEFLNDYAPNYTKELAQKIGGKFEMAMVLTNYDLSKLIDGRVVALLFGQFDDTDMGAIPQLNFFAGLGSQGQNFSSFIKEQLLDNDFKVVEEKNGGIYGYNSSEYIGNNLTLNEASKEIGTESFNLFLDLTTINLDEMGMGAMGQIINEINYIKANYNVDGGKFIIKSKNNKENILKTLLDASLEMF